MYCNIQDFVTIFLKRGEFNLKYIILIYLCLFILPSEYFAQYRKVQKDHAYSNSLVFGLEGNAGLAFSDYRDITPGGGIKGLVEYYFPTSGSGIFGLRLYTGYEILHGADKYKFPGSFTTDLLLAGIGGVYSLSWGDWFFPFISAGFSAQSYTVESPGGRFRGNITSDHRSLGLDGELGVRIALSHSFILSLSSAYHYLPDDELDGYSFGSYPDFYATGQVGISYAISFGSKYEKVEPRNPGVTPPAQEKKPVVVQKEQNQNTEPIQLKITPIDTSKQLTNKRIRLSDIIIPEDTMSYIPQGNQTAQDNLPSNVETELSSGSKSATNKTVTTKTGTNETGSREKTAVKTPSVKTPLAKTSSADEILKAASKEKGTQKEKKTENKRIEIAKKDSPAPPVNKQGKNKPEETVSDRDLASNSFEVENVGEIMEDKSSKLPKEILLHGELTFYRDEATIQPEAYSELNKIARELKKSSKAKWVIEGYTDNQGNEQQLQQLSYQRANAIMKYLSSKGVPPSKFKIVGMGSKNPVEDNSKVYGRMMNRRIVIKRVE